MTKLKLSWLVKIGYYDSPNRLSLEVASLTQGESQESHRRPF